MKNFDFMDKMIDKGLLALFVLALLIFFLACSNKVTYEIYLEHQPQEPLYVTDSEEDAQDYYKQYKPFHSDMYITKK